MKNLFNVSWSVNETKLTDIEYIDIYIDAVTKFPYLLPTHLQVLKKKIELKNSLNWHIKAFAINHGVNCQFLLERLLISKPNRAVLEAEYIFFFKGRKDK